MGKLRSTNGCSPPILCVAVVLFYSLIAQAGAQDERLEGVHFKRDDQDRVVGLNYWGSVGLRRGLPPNTSQLKGVHVYYGTKLTADDIAVLGGLDKVRDLMLGGVSSASEAVTVEGSLEKLAGMKGLRTLWLCKESCRDDDLEFITKLPELESVDLFADNYDYEPKSRITDRSAEFLKRAKKLQRISIYGSERLTDKFVDVISRELPDFEDLELWLAPGLTDKSLELLANRCTKLKQLDLRSKRFTDRGVQHLTAAKQLERLALESTPLTSACAESVQKLTRLRMLTLSFPTIDEPAVRAIASLPNLQILAMRKPALTAEQFALFGKHAKLESAFLDCTQISEAQVIEVIQTMPKLRHLEVGPNETLQTAVNRELLGR